MAQKSGIKVKIKVCRKKTLLYLRGAHEQLLNVQLVQKQCPPHSVNGHTDVRLTVGNFQKLLDVLRVTENTVNIGCTCMILSQKKKKRCVSKPLSLIPRQHHPRHNR